MRVYVGLKTTSFGRRMVVSVCSVALPLYNLFVCVCARTRAVNLTALKQGF